MKILLIGFSKITYMPYLNFYLSVLEGTGAVIHIIKWNRDNTSDVSLDQDKIVVHEFDCNNWMKRRGFKKYLIS